MLNDLRYGNLRYARYLNNFLRSKELRDLPEIITTNFFKSCCDIGFDTAVYREFESD